MTFYTRWGDLAQRYIVKDLHSEARASKLKALYSIGFRDYLIFMARILRIAKITAYRGQVYKD